MLVVVTDGMTFCREVVDVVRGTSDTVVVVDTWGDEEEVPRSFVRVLTDEESEAFTLDERE